MKKIIITLTLILVSNSLLFSQLDTNQWGPKVKLQLVNEEGQITRLFFGVDTLATDGWDSSVVFQYKNSELDTTLMEDIDLPPAPPQGMYCRLIRDTMPENICYSYVDFRNIPSNIKKFYHQYRVQIKWANTAYPKIEMNWGRIPNGIDSIKIRCIQWLDDDSIANMRSVEKLDLEYMYSNYSVLNIYVWYNKDHIGISNEDTIDALVFPNPANDNINFYNEDYNDYLIINSIGSKAMIGNLNLYSNNIINIQHLPSGTYTLLLNKKNETKILSFVK